MTLVALGCVSAMFMFTGCNNQQPTVSSKNITVGTVQKDISVGMYSTDVIKALGSPNIITKDKNGKTTWVYDKISTYHSKTHGGINFVRMNNNDFVIAGGVLAGAVDIAGSAASSTVLVSAATLGLFTLWNTKDDYEYKTEQKTITIILDFDKDDKLDNFSYMYSSF